VQLELIDPRQLHDNKFLSHPVAVEQYLMEGGYNRVFKTRADIPADSYAYFHDIMADTVRCASESMLESIPNAIDGHRGSILLGTWRKQKWTWPPAAFLNACTLT
jgi:hypothetical protein